MARKKTHFQWTVEDGEVGPISERRDRSEAREIRQDLLSLARRLEAMPSGELRRLPLDQQTIDAVLHMAKLGAQSAHRRQMLRVQKLLRDEDLEALDSALAGAEPNAHLIRAAERWRARLVEGDEALHDYLDAHPSADRQHLRALIRQARKPGAAGKSAARKLFQALQAVEPLGEE
jgi:ribosome-associated protein